MNRRRRFWLGFALVLLVVVMAVVAINIAMRGGGSSGVNKKKSTSPPTTGPTPIINPWVPLPFPTLKNNYSYVFNNEGSFAAHWGLENCNVPRCYATLTGEDQILEWYRQNFTGWTFEGENISQNVAFQKYKSNNTGALVLVFPHCIFPNQTCVVVAWGSWEDIESAGSQVNLSMPGPFFGPGSGQGTMNFTVSPVDLNALFDITPLGNTAPSSHIFPADHMYVGLYPGLWNISASADGVITMVSCGPSGLPDLKYDYGITVDYSSTFAMGFCHLASIAPWILNQTGPILNGTFVYPEIPVKAGEVIGQATSNHIPYPPNEQTNSTTITEGNILGHAGFDLNAYDLTVHTNIMLQCGYDPFGYCAVAGVYYFDKSIQEIMFPKINRIAGDEPIVGKFDYDQPGKLVGNWIVEDQVNSPYMLSFSYDTYNSTQIRICDGGTITQPGEFLVLGNSPDPASVSPANGSVIFYLTTYANPTFVNYTLLVKMDGIPTGHTYEQIEVEAFPGVVSNPVFTSAETLYYRGFLNVNGTID